MIHTEDLDAVVADAIRDSVVPVEQNPRVADLPQEKALSKLRKLGELLRWS